MVGAAGAQAPVAATAQDGAAGVQTGKTRLHGVVTDPDGALIPGATVLLTGNGPAVKAVSGSDGSYSAAVAPGTYTVTFTMPGFATYTATGIEDWRGERDDAECEDADWRAVAGDHGGFGLGAVECGSGFECQRDDFDGQGSGCAVG